MELQRVGHNWATEQQKFLIYIGGITYVIPTGLFSFQYHLYLFSWSNCGTCGILVPQRMNPHPLQWKHGVLTTGPPGKSLSTIFKMPPYCTGTSKIHPIHWIRFHGQPRHPLSDLHLSCLWFPTITNNATIITGRELPGASWVAQCWKNPPANVGGGRDTGYSIGLRRSPGEGNGNPLQYFLPGKFHEQRNLAGYSPWGRKEPDVTKRSTEAAADTSI